MTYESPKRKIPTHEESGKLDHVIGMMFNQIQQLRLSQGYLLTIS